jgi:hypothetical protein
MVDQAKAKMPSPDDVQNNQSIPTVINAKACVVFICNWKRSLPVMKSLGRVLSFALARPTAAPKGLYYGQFIKSASLIMHIYIWRI